MLCGEDEALPFDGDTVRWLEDDVIVQLLFVVIEYVSEGCAGERVGFDSDVLNWHPSSIAHSLVRKRCAFAVVNVPIM